MLNASEFKICIQIQDPDGALEYLLCHLGPLHLVNDEGAARHICASSRCPSRPAGMCWALSSNSLTMELWLSTFMQSTPTLSRPQTPYCRMSCTGLPLVLVFLEELHLSLCLTHPCQDGE